MRLIELYEVVNRTVLLYFSNEDKLASNLLIKPESLTNIN